jgi:hypothetical protein
MERCAFEHVTCARKPARPPQIVNTDRETLAASRCANGSRPARSSEAAWGTGLPARERTSTAVKPGWSGGGDGVVGTELEGLGGAWPPAPEVAGNTGAAVGDPAQVLDDPSAPQ